MKIGIIGTESSHAKAFAEILQKLKVEALVDDGLKVSADVDGVMIVTRDGNTHKSLAMPFIDAGLPVWIDKPLTVRCNEARELLDAAKTKGALVTGGSTCKFSPELHSLSKSIHNGEFGQIRSAMLSFPIILDSPYNGFHFYAHHLVERTLTLFGYEMRAVRAFEKNGGIVCLAKYDDFDVIMNFQPDVWDGYITILGTKAQMSGKLILPNNYEHGVRAFIKMAETKIEPIPHHNLIFSVAVVNAIQKSYEENIEVCL